MNIKNKLFIGAVTVLTGAVLAAGVPAVHAQEGVRLQTKTALSAEAKAKLPSLHLSGNGAIVLKSAEITGISGTTLNANATWNGQIVSWTVTTDSETKVVVGKTPSSLAAVKVGDKVLLRGTLTTWGAQPTFYAKQVIVVNADTFAKDPNKKNFAGTVASVDANTNTVVVTDRKGTQQTIALDANTVIRTGKNTTGTIANIQPNAVVTVRGRLSSTGSIIANKIILGWRGFFGLMARHF